MGKTRKMLFIGVILLLAFLIWTVLVCTIDVQAIGPGGSSVGFATLNGFVHNLTGVNMSLYVITDWLGLVPIGTAFGFAILGLIQMLKRKSILKVDRDILALGAFYIAVIAVYILFEKVVINYRPILIDGYSEVSYPSSTTTLVLSVMASAVMQLRVRIKNAVFRHCTVCAALVFIIFMVMGRILSGVHWLSDIIGGMLISFGLVAIYYAKSGLIVNNV